MPYDGSSAAISLRRVLRSLRCLFVIDNARAALRMPDGRLGPGGEMLHVGLSRPPAVHITQVWQWVYDVEDMEKSGGGQGGEARLEDELGGRDWNGWGRTR
jgi:hypothetical protein